MRTRYKEHAYYCGDNYIDLQVFPEFSTFRGKRKRKFKTTTEIQQRLNQKNKQRKLIRLLNTNFTENDIRFDVTYDKFNNPQSPSEAKKQMKNFIKRLKNYRKKNNLPELKYVYVTERGSKTGRFHHHIVMNGDVSINALAKIWGKGFTQAKPLQFDEKGIEGLSNYLLKKPVTGNDDGSGSSYSCSRNLKQPKERKHSGRLSRKKIEFMATYTDTSALERLYPDYQLVEISPFYNEVNGGYYFSAKFYKPQRKRGCYVQKR
jgi:hypothetical protein